jgi:spore coat polysaccharide biosynthesis protein SpsF
MKVVGIIQARLGSTRLPNKMLASILGQPMLGVLIKRLAPCRFLDEIVVATTDLPQDRTLELLSKECGVSCFRGSEDDCLDRFYYAAKQSDAGIVVRLTGDNPLVDASFVDQIVEQFLLESPPLDYLGPTVHRTYPIGLSAEVFSFAALLAAWQEDKDQKQREHVTPFIWQNPDRFRVKYYHHDRNLGHWRWTVDTPADLAFVQKIFEHFGHYRFSWRDVVEVLEKHPEWMMINQSIQQHELAI